jgi:hypothetical protein
MTAEIHAIPGVTLPDRPADEQPRAEVIAMCEQQYLEWARSGELQAIGIAAVKRGRFVTTSWVGACGYFHEMTCAVSHLFFRFGVMCATDNHTNLPTEA